MLEAREKTQLVIIQPTTLCNLDCAYCYLANRRSKNVMSRSVLEAIGKNVCQSSLINPLVEVSFHSGEPLLAGCSWFDEALSILERAWPPHVSPIYSVQTNGTLINDDWVDLFRRWKIRVSLSVDGPEGIHDSNRRNWSDRGSFDMVARGIAALQRGKVPFAILCVLTAANIDVPNELFRFFEALKPVVVGFNVEEEEGVNKRSSLQSPEHASRVQAFFTEYLREARQAGFPHKVREVEQLSMFLAASFKGSQVRSDVATPFRIISIAHSGEFSTFSPELADVTDLRHGSFTFGNIVSGPPEQVVDCGKLSRVWTEIAAGLKLCEDSCEYFPICGGGAPANKLAEHGTFAAAETSYCRNSVKAVADAFANELIHELQRDQFRTS